MNKYIGFYKDKKYEIEAIASYQAQQTIAQKQNIKDSYNISVMLAENENGEVTHLPLF